MGELIMGVKSLLTVIVTVLYHPCFPVPDKCIMQPCSQLLVSTGCSTTIYGHPFNAHAASNASHSCLHEFCAEKLSCCNLKSATIMESAELLSCDPRYPSCNADAIQQGTERVMCSIQPNHHLVPYIDINKLKLTSLQTPRYP